MLRPVRLFLVAVSFTAIAPQAADARLLRCTVEDVRENVDGSLANTPIGKISAGRDVLFDTERLELTMPGGVRWGFKLLQAATSENDLIASRTLQGPASLSHMIFQLRAWQPDLPFLFVFGWEVQSGRCKLF